MAEPSCVSAVVLCRAGGGRLEQAIASVRRQVHCLPDILMADVGISARDRKRFARQARAASATVIEADPGAVWGAALDKASGSHIAFLRDIDEWLPAKLSVCIARLRDGDARYALNGCVGVDGTGATLAQNGRASDPGNDLVAALASLFQPAPTTGLSALVIESELAREALHGPPWSDKASVLATFLGQHARLGIFIPERLTATRVEAPLQEDASWPRLRQDQHLDALADVLRALESDALAAFLRALWPLPVGDEADLLGMMLASVERLASLPEPEARAQAVVLLRESFRRAPARAAAWTSTHSPRMGWARFAIARGHDLANDFEADRDTLLALGDWAPPRGATRFSRLRGWRNQKRAEASVASDLSQQRSIAIYALGTRVQLSSVDAEAYLTQGFSTPEPWGRWTDGFTARLALRLETKFDAGELRIWPAMMFSRVDEPCAIKITVNRGAASLYEVSPGRLIHHPVLAPRGIVDVRIEVVHPKESTEQPLEEGRQIGVGMEWFEIVSHDRQSVIKI